MTRSNYTDDLDSGALNCWRGAVHKAVTGKRGQQFLREMRDALDAMPDKKLIESALVTEERECCAMGAVCLMRGLDVSDVDPYDPEQVAKVIGIAMALVCEIAYQNDEWGHPSPEERWRHMREWVSEQIIDR